MMITPYRFFFTGGFCGDNEELELYITQEGKIIADDKYGFAYEYSNGSFLYVCYSNERIEEDLRPATKKELQDADLWDMVVNKEDFPSLEDELEEYLRIGEEIEKEKTSDTHKK